MVADTTSSFKKWLVRRLKMDGFDASFCHTSWVTTIDCPAGMSSHNEFLLINPNIYPTDQTALFFFSIIFLIFNFGV